MYYSIRCNSVAHLQFYHIETINFSDVQKGKPRLGNPWLRNWPYTGKEVEQLI